MDSGKTMMSPDEVKNLTNVYRKLVDQEYSRGWTVVDDHMYHLSYLDDDGLVREAEVIFCHHDGKNPRCQKEHNIEECFVPILVEAVNSILGLHRETLSLHAKNRYVLEYYLALDQERMIVVD